jgi:hypothetical protein
VFPNVLLTPKTIFSKNINTTKIKNGKPMLKRTRNLMVAFLTVSDKQGCQIKLRVARYEFCYITFDVIDIET